MDQVRTVVEVVSLDQGMERSRGEATVAAVPGVLEVIVEAGVVAVVAAVVSEAVDHASKRIFQTSTAGSVVGCTAVDVAVVVRCLGSRVQRPMVGCCYTLFQRPTLRLVEKTSMRRWGTFRCYRMSLVRHSNFHLALET